MPGSAASVISDAATSERMYNKGFEKYKLDSAKIKALQAHNSRLTMDSVQQDYLGKKELHLIMGLRQK